jgi:hypothetical protein
MEIFSHIVTTFECDGCQQAHLVEMPVGAKLAEMKRRVRDFHREHSPTCPRDAAQLADPRVASFNDQLTREKHTLHFRMGWRDADELDLSREEKKTPTLIIDPTQHRPMR